MSDISRDITVVRGSDEARQRLIVAMAKELNLDQTLLAPLVVKCFCDLPSCQGWRFKNGKPLRLGVIG